MLIFSSYSLLFIYVQHIKGQFFLAGIFKNKGEFHLIARLGVKLVRHLGSTVRYWSISSERNRLLSE
jgi:hypothetical protein